MTFPHYPKSREIYSHTGLRGIAALSVFLFHLSIRKETFPGLPENIVRFFDWASYAVDLFFILSGFILNWVYLSKSSNINWISYFRARVARITPLYYLTTLLFIPHNAYSIIKYGFKYVGNYYPLILASNFLMLSGIIDGYHITFNAAAWSISVEFFCYLLIFPFLIYIGKVLNKQSSKYYYMYPVALILIFLLYKSYSFKHVNLGFFNWDASALCRGVFGFSLGFVLCNIYRVISIKKTNLIILNGILVLCSICFFLSNIKCIPGFLLLFSFPFLVLFSAFDKGIVCNFLKLPVLQWLGDRSYSIYLWHMPLLLLFSIVIKHIFQRLFHLSQPSGLVNYLILVSIVLVVSELSYRFFEEPCRDYIRLHWLKPKNNIQITSG